MTASTRRLVARFSRPREAEDAVEVIRSDGSTLRWSIPSYHASLPHDLVHLVVESAFGLQRGFWGLVDGGVDPHAINASMRSRTFTDEPGELLAAEGLAAIHWFDPDVAPAQRCEDATARCREFGAEPPTTLVEARAARVSEVLRAARAAFRESGGRIDATFDRRMPEAGFDALEAALCGPHRAQRRDT